MIISYMKNVKRIWRGVLDVFFPPVCVNCGKYAGEESLSFIICRPCFGSINVNSVWLPFSGNAIIAAAGSYGDKPLRELIHSLKYGGIEKSAVILGSLIAGYLTRIGLTKLVDINNTVIIPIPLHRERSRKRGFNQSELIGNEVGRILGIPVKNALKRVKDTAPQIEMKSDQAREENIKGAFKSDPLLAKTVLADKDLILLDDVFTTGATVKEAIRSLKEFKARKIIVLVAARAGY